MGNKEIDLLQKGRGPRDRGIGEGKQGKGIKKINEMCYVHASPPHGKGNL